MLARAELSETGRAARTGLFMALCVALTIAAFSGALSELVRRWINEDEYSHGFFIPLIAGWLLWTRRDQFALSLGRPSWLGAAFIMLAFAMHVVGELSALFILSHVGFIIALAGVVLAGGGFPLLRLWFAPLIFLLFAIPLPYFLQAILTWRLQLISSELGVLVIRLFQIPVYLEGNIIDLGNYKVQVVEACSGLRYLYPLSSLAFLAAYFFHAPLWQRALVFVSAVPITILMNSFRIGMVGVLVNFFGTQSADGLLHFFEGWIVFIACAAMLIGEIYLLARFALGRSFAETFGVPRVSPASPAMSIAGIGAVQRSLPIAACLALVCVSGAAIFFLTQRQEIIPERARFVSFPNRIGQWVGTPSLMEPQVEHALGLEDYILSDYKKGDSSGINLYVAYYASQRQGTSPHSPIVCMPGGGWRIVSFARTNLANSNGALPLNRAVIERQSTRQLVYYWFVQRGRNVANEYWSKWYLFADAIVANRTDGALVRVTTPVYQGEAEGDADRRLQTFIADLEPRLGGFLPARSLSATRSFSDLMSGRYL